MKHDPPKRPVQYFTPEYIAKCKEMTPTQILEFLEEFRLLFGAQPSDHQKIDHTQAK